MTASYVTVTNAIASDLVTNVATLASYNSAGQLKIHKHTPQTMERLQQSDGFKHLAVWLDPQEPVQIQEPMATGVHNHTMRFEVLYWEPSPEGESGVGREDDAQTIMTLADDITSRIYTTAFQTLGSSTGQWRLWFESFTPSVGGEHGVRILDFTLTAQVAHDFS